MLPNGQFDVEEAQRIREELLAPAYRALEELAKPQPENGQQITFAKNHVRMALAIMELGFGMALTNGLDPLANRVAKKEDDEEHND